MHANVKQNVVPLITPGLKVACSQCNLRELCLPFGLDDHDMARLDNLIGGGRKVKRGHHLYRAGDAFESIFAVRSGFFKIGRASCRERV